MKSWMGLAALTEMDPSKSRAAALCLALALLAAPVGAQPAISLSAGFASYDLSGVGTSGVIAARADLPLAPRLDLQLGSGFFWYETQTDRNVSMLLPEAGLIARPPIGIPLFVGAGAGRTVGVSGSPDDDFTLWAALGLDLWDRRGWAIRPEFRLRAVDPWVGTIGDFTIGVRRRLAR